MKYVRVDWANQQTNAPVMLYTELDESRFETRKVEIFPGGLCGWATADQATGHTTLGREAMPELKDVGSRIEPIEISREEFEWVWSRWVR